MCRYLGVWRYRCLGVQMLQNSMPVFCVVKAYFRITPLCCFAICKLCFCTYNPRTSWCPQKPHLPLNNHTPAGMGSSVVGKRSQLSFSLLIQNKKMLQICNSPKFYSSKKSSYIASVSRKGIFLTPL